jgi:PIN domain nuclease of toxin-antitoxin system
MSMTSPVVVDASAVLALLNSEPGAEAVERALSSGAIISAVNLSEVVGKLVDVGLSPGEVRQVVGGIGLEVKEFETAQAYESGLLRSRAVSRDISLSLGDRACMALAIHVELPVLTADKAWLKLSLPVEVRVIR